MFGISSNGKDLIGRIIEEIFDKIALQMLGIVPRLQHKKMLIFNTKPGIGLTNLFIQGMENKPPNYIELDALKGLLGSSYDYIDSLKSKTRSNIAERVDGIVKEASVRKEKVTETEIHQAINVEMVKAGKHLKVIAESEGTKFRNIGSLMNISRMAASNSDSDPSVFFVIVRDKNACSVCVRLHLNEDGSPRVWKMSELKQGYYIRGEDNPSACGAHPSCRCFLTYLPKGFGFENGRISYKTRDHDEFTKQRS